MDNNADFISTKAFSLGDLKRYLKTMKKLRGKKKKSEIGKKIVLTNHIQYLNLLYNTNLQMNKKPRRNLLKTHPFKYPSMIPDNKVDEIWTKTKVPTCTSKGATIGDLNKVYKELMGFDLIVSPLGHKKLPKKKRNPIIVQSAN